MQTNRIRGSLSGVWHFFESFCCSFSPFRVLFCNLCRIMHNWVSLSDAYHRQIIDEIYCKNSTIAYLLRIGEANVIRRIEIGLCQLYFVRIRLRFVQLVVRLNLHTIDRHHWFFAIKWEYRTPTMHTKSYRFNWAITSSDSVLFPFGRHFFFFFAFSFSPNLRKERMKNTRLLNWRNLTFLRLKIRWTLNREWMESKAQQQQKNTEKMFSHSRCRIKHQAMWALRAQIEWRTKSVVFE